MTTDETKQEAEAEHDRPRRSISTDLGGPTISTPRNTDGRRRWLQVLAGQ